MKQLLCLLLFLPIFAGGQIITTIGGTGSYPSGGDGGPATAAAIAVPFGGVFDKYGNYYFPDGGNNKVRKIDTAGIITSVVGSGSGTFSGDYGPATACGIIVRDVAFDTAGNMYVGDGNYRIRKVDKSTNLIYTIAGNGVSAYVGDGLPATNASLDGVGDICFDKWNNLYIVNQNTVRKVNTSGVITTFAGNGTGGFSGDGGPATNAQFTGPSGVAADDSGNIYIADRGPCNRVRKVNTSGIVSTFAGNGTGTYIGDGMPATSAQIVALRVGVDRFAQVYIVDDYNSRVYRVDKGGIIHLAAGNGVAGFSGDNGPATAAELNNPCGIAFDMCSSSLYIPEGSYNKRIRKVSFPPELTVPTISLSGITTAPAATTVTVTAAVANAGGSYLLHWLNHGIEFTTTTVPSVTYTKGPGNDTITAGVVSTAAYGCYDSTTSIAHVVTTDHTGVDNVSSPPVMIYPNPAHDVLNILSPGKINAVEICDLLGQSVYREVSSALALAGTFLAMTVLRVNIENLPVGVYVVKITDCEDGRWIGKFVKE